MAASAVRTGTEECSICQDVLTNPRILPCIHAFCLDCLEGYCRSLGKLPGDDVQCPVCRTEFKIPKKGVADLPVKARVEKRCSQPTAPMQQPGIDYAPSGECLQIKQYIKVALKIKIKNKNCRKNRATYVSKHSHFFSDCVPPIPHPTDKFQAMHE